MPCRQRIPGLMLVDALHSASDYISGLLLRAQAIQ